MVESKAFKLIMSSRIIFGEFDPNQTTNEGNMLQMCQIEIIIEIGKFMLLKYTSMSL